MANDEPQHPPREGSVAGYDRDVEYIDAGAWVDDVIEDPPDGNQRKSRLDATLFRAKPARNRFDPGFAGMAAEMAILAGAAEATAQHTSAESRHLAVDAPTEARPGEEFVIHVRLTMDASGKRSAVLRPIEVSEDGRVVNVDVSASDNLLPLTTTTAELKVRPGEDSDFARFALQALRDGKATVDVRAFADQQFIGAVHLDMMVHADAQKGQQHTQTASTLTGPDHGGLTLEIRLDSKKSFYEFQLRADGFNELPVRADLGDLDAAARGLQQQLNELARGTQYSPEAMQAILRGQGAALWKLLPPAVQAKLLGSVGVADRLSIVLTDNDPVPWELVYASGPSASGFLSDFFLVTRWQYGASAPLEVGRGERCYVLPPGGPTAAATEIATVQEHIGGGISISRVDDVLAQLDRHAFGLMHFATHNAPNFTRPGASSIQLDQPFVQAMVAGYPNGSLSKSAPLVFINACSSTTPTLTWASAEGWATKFLDAGAGCFIGTLWEIRDGSAAIFANEFYRELGKKRPLGTAFRVARAAIKAENDPTWLAYTLYANPFAYFEGIEK